ncbi:hypothetical protein ABZ016_19940 [Streptomyces sp. NPDC006372]|uniref:hypothetical protein n=1 Tax=Streptomyces sp. NPDC006372 TaxID=3155599 RepID=UPI0033ADA67B
MAGHTLTTASALMCPHGGTVTATAATAPTVHIAGAPVVTAADAFTVGGCPFQIPAAPPIPSPCVVVQWTVPDARTTAQGAPTLSESSAGICLAATGVPQGPVQIVSTQSQVETS